MPSISKNSSGGVIRWDKDDWLKGLGQNQETSLNQTLTVDNGFAFMNGMDPFRALGYLQPGVNPSDATNISVVDATVSNAVTYGDKAYFIAGTKLHEFTISTNTVTNNGTFPRTITGAVTGLDVVIYNVGSAPFLFYKYAKSSGGDVGRYDLASTFVDNYMSTVPSGAALLDTDEFAGMIKGSDDILYIFDGPNLHYYDGQSGTFVKNKLTLPKSTIITCAAKTEDMLVLFNYEKTTALSSSNRSNCTAFAWNYVDADPVHAYPIDANYISASFSYNGTIGCFGSGRANSISPGQQNKLFLFDGSKFQVILTLPQSNPVFGGVEVAGNVIYWNSGGKIFQYGSPYVGLNKALNIVSVGGGSSSGFLKNLTGSNLFSSSGASTGQGLQKFSTGFFPTAQFITSAVTPPMPQGRRARIKEIKIHWGKVTSGGPAFELQVVLNKGQSAAYVVQGKTVVTEPYLYETYRQDINGVNFGSLKFDTIELEGTYSSGAGTSSAPPYLQAVEVYYTYIRI